MKKSSGALGSPGDLPANFSGSIAGPIGDRAFFENAIGSRGIACDDLRGALGVLGTWGVSLGEIGVALVTLGGICEWPWEFLEEV